MPRRKIEDRDITDAEALELLLHDEEQGTIETMMAEHLKELVKLDAKSSRSLVEELVDTGITNKDAVTLVNLLPDNKYEVISLLSGGTRPYISEETAEKVVSLIKKHLGKTRK